MSDETSLQTVIRNDVDLFDTGILRNDAETDNSGTDIASSPEIRLDRLRLRNSFASLDSQNRGAAASTIRLGVDGNHSAGPYRASTRHTDLFASLAELDDESTLEPFMVSPYFMRGSGHSTRSQHWHASVHHPSSTSTNDSLFDRYLNRLRVEDQVFDSDVFPEVLSEVNEPEEREDAVGPTDWRNNCKNIQDRLRSILSSERFTDVYFYIGGSEGGERSGEQESKTCKRDSRCNSVLSPRPPMCPMSRRSTASAQRRQNTEQQRRITSAIAQASGNASAVAQTTPAASDAEDLESEARNREVTVEEKAKTLATMLLSMRDTTITPESQSSISSSQSSNSSSPSEVCPYFTGTTDTAVMCHLSDISDIDVESRCEKSRDRDKSRDREREVTKSANSVTQSTARETAHGGVRRFAAHRLVLAIASPVFEAMFFGAFAEATAAAHTRSLPTASKTTDTVATLAGILEMHVTDVTPAAFQQCLHYIYYDDMTLTDALDDLYDTLYAAKKYLLTPLATACKNRLVSLMTPQNVLLQLNRCSTMDEDELFKICWHTIDVLTPEVLTSEHFTDLERQTLLKLISRETLYCEEWEIFEALMRWSKLECTRMGITVNTLNVAGVMKDFLPYIRFTTMSLEDFIIHVSKSGILSLEVQHTILLQIATKMFAESENVAGKTAEKVSCVEQEGGARASSQKRKGPQVHKCRRFTRTVALTNKEAYWSETEYVIFKVSKPVFLAGVGLFRPINKGTQLKVKVEVRQCTLNQSAEVNTPNGGFSVTYRSTGVSTLISGGSGHRHGHRHAGIQMPSYLRSSNDSRRRRELSNHGNNTHSRLSRTAEAASSPSTTIPRTLFKSVESRGGTLCALEATLNCAHSTSPVVETRFSRPIKLKSNHYYLLSVTPEEGRNTRCYFSRAPARSRVAVRTHIPFVTTTTSDIDAGMVAIEHSPPQTSKLVNFDFAFGNGSVGGDAVSSGDKHLINTLGAVGEAPHVLHILFFPVS
ncbi:BTB/POZ domain-containing protein 6 [Taenia crassiceps]|uniref:BTB/POZ domain-containing protein 6 n=1 Tax=Taenia crassiceps TaxID=6207 RepID=A0ABR4Q6Y6_9CEST